MKVLDKFTQRAYLEIAAIFEDSKIVEAEDLAYFFAYSLSGVLGKCGFKMHHFSQ